MSEKNVTSRIDNVFKVEKDRGRKVPHCITFYDDTWELIKENATYYNVSISVYLEKLQQFYLESNKKE